MHAVDSPTSITNLLAALSAVVQAAAPLVTAVAALLALWKGHQVQQAVQVLDADHALRTVALSRKIDELLPAARRGPDGKFVPRGEV
jgi:hypothetical protein